MTDDEIAEAAKELESYRVERKRKFSPNKSAVEEAICAFANDLPGSGTNGLILIGVDDDGTPSNTPIDDQLLINLAAIRSDGNILPFPQFTVEKRQLDGVDIAVVEVSPSHNPPVRLRGRVCIRVGPRKDTATRDEERILTERRRAWDGPFDQKPVYGTSLDDLDLSLFQDEYLPSAVDTETRARNNRSTAEQLASLHLANVDAIPNVAGLLLVGQEPTTWIKGAYVQFIRFNGSKMTSSITDRREITGPLPRVIRQLDEILRANVRIAVQVAGRDREFNQPDYPLDALQQLTRNALMHRNYETSNAPTQVYWFDDRIEIHNSGGLFGRATEATFGNPGGNDYRNPTLAGGLHALGYVQRFGMGIPLAREVCQSNGNPELEFTFGQTTFAVILRRA